MALHGNHRNFNQNQHYAMDYITDAGRVITNNMSAIHHRQCFSSHMALEEIAYGTPWDILFQTPADYYCHLKFINVWMNWGYGFLQIWEDIEDYTGGWVVDMFNRYRPSAVATTSTTTGTTSTSTTTTGTTSTSTTSTTTTTTGTTSTTEAPHVYVPSSEIDFRLTWSEEYRHQWELTEAQIDPAHPGTTNVIIKEGGLATLGNAVEIDAYRFIGLLRVTADEWMDHEWVFRKDKMYLFRFYRIPALPTTTTEAPTTSTTTFVPL